MVFRCAVLFGLLGLFQASLGPLIPLLADRHHLADATAGLLVTGFFLGCLVSTAVGGALSDRGARVLQPVSSVLFVLGVAGVALPVAWPVPLLAVGVAGLGFGGLVLVVNTAMAARGLSSVNLVNGVYGLGAAAGPALVSLTGGGLLFVAVALVAAVFMPGRLEYATRVPGERLRIGATLVLFCVLLFCYAGIETGLSSWEAVHLRAHGYGTATAAALTSLFWLGLAIGRLLVPVVTRTWAPSRVVLTVLGGLLAGLALLTTAGVAPAGYFVVGLLAGPVFPTVLAWIARTLPRPRRVNAIVLSVAMLGNAAMPAVVGFGLQSTSDLALPAFVAVPVLGALAVAVVLRARTREVSAEPR